MPVCAEHELMSRKVDEIHEAVVGNTKEDGIASTVRNHETRITGLETGHGDLKKLFERRKHDRTTNRLSFLHDLDWFRWVILIMIASTFLGVKPNELLDIVLTFMRG